MERFKLLYTKISNLGAGVCLIRSNYTGNLRILPEYIVQSIIQFKGFASLPEHIEKLWNQTDAHTKNLISNPLQKGTLLSLCRDLAQEGFLQSEEEVLRRIKRIRERDQLKMTTPAIIERIGIPTANRPGALKRTIETFSEKTQKHGRKVQFIVVDDSKKEIARTQNLEIIQMLRQTANINIEYIDSQTRELQARKIIKKSGVPERVVRFTLFGPQNTLDTYGAPRNALLLKTIGEMHLQTDDDTTAEILEVPYVDNSLALSGKNQAENCTIFRDHKEIVETLPKINIDPLSIHEKLLGRHPGYIIKNFLNQDTVINIEEINESLLDAICRSDARINISFMGAAGDSGMTEFYHRIFPNNNEHKQLCDNQIQYNMLLRSRYILRAVPRYIIGNGPAYINMNVGLDNRNLLPPFIPYGRGEDTVFGILLKTCFPGALKGYIPRYAIQHKPWIIRGSYKGNLQFPVLSANRLLTYFIMKFSKEPIGEKAKGLQTIGKMLNNIGTLKNNHFIEYTAEVMSDIIREHIIMAQKALEEDENSPDQWGEDMLEYIDSALESVEAPGFGVPSDLFGNISERLEVFQKRMVQVGEMLEYWPEMIDTSI